MQVPLTGGACSSSQGVRLLDDGKALCGCTTIVYTPRSIEQTLLSILYRGTWI